MNKEVDAVVIGGGAMGLAVGYNLVRKGMKNTVVLQAGYLNAGSTGRNLGVLKERIPNSPYEVNEALVKISREGLRIHARLSTDTGINTFYRKSGNLVIARTEDEIRQLERYHKQYQRLGLKDDYLSVKEIQSKWPYINANNIMGGFYSPDEAIVHPFGLTWAYFESIKRMGGRVEKQNKVKKIIRTVDGYRVEAENNSFESENVVIASSADSAELAGQLGFKVPLVCALKERLISEPIRPFFGPTIERISEGFQISQTMRGEVLGTIRNMAPVLGLTENTFRFLKDFASETLSIIPVFRDLRIIRQWTEILDKTPDLLPIIGSLEEGLYITCGDNDHQITLAPIVGRLLAHNIINGSTSPLLKDFDPHRFNHHPASGPAEILSPIVSD